MATSFKEGGKEMARAAIQRAESAVSEPDIAPLIAEEMRYYHDGHYMDRSDAKYQLMSFAERVKRLYNTPPAAAVSEPVADKWRDLALRFDAHRMSALAHLRMMVQDPTRHIDEARKFLTATPPAEAKPLTDEQIESCMKTAYANVQGRNLEHAFARAIEAAHNIGAKE